MVLIFKLLTLLNSENFSQVSHNLLMVVFSMVLKEKFKCNLDHYAKLTFACASNEKHAVFGFITKKRFGRILSLSNTSKSQDIPVGMCKIEEMDPEQEKERCGRRREG